MEWREKAKCIPRHMYRHTHLCTVTAMDIHMHTHSTFISLMFRYVKWKTKARGYEIPLKVESQSQKPQRCMIDPIRQCTEANMDKSCECIIWVMLKLIVYTTRGVRHMAIFLHAIYHHKKQMLEAQVISPVYIHYVISIHVFLQLIETIYVTLNNK